MSRRDSSTSRDRPRTLERVQKLAPGSRIAFDYFSRELMQSALGKLFSATLWLQYGESLHFVGISMKRPSRDALSAFLESTGLALAEHESVGKRVPWYGFAFGRQRELRPVGPGWRTRIRTPKGKREK